MKKYAAIMRQKGKTEILHMLNHRMNTTSLNEGKPLTEHQKLNQIDILVDTTQEIEKKN